MLQNINQHILILSHILIFVKIQAISSLNLSIDSEYLRIIQDLRSLGLNPSGNKNTDKFKLEQAKKELIDKIQTKDNSNQQSKTEEFQKIFPVEDTSDSVRAEMEEQRLGAMNIAELNKLYFNL